MKVPGVASIYLPLKDAVLYIKGRRRHVIDLDDNFKTLRLMHGNLLARGDHIEGKLKFKTTNKTYDELRKRIQDITRKYEQIESKYKKWGGNSSTQVATNENVANEGEGSTSSSPVAHSQPIGQRRIWTRNFFNNARLDKDVTNLIDEIGALNIEDVKLETLTEEILFKWKNVPERVYKPLAPYVQKLLEYLQNASTKRIGIHGEPQVGKSTILKDLNNYFDPKSSSSSISLKYDIVIWVDFPSKDSGDITENMQRQILRSIHESDEQSSGHNAAKINEALAEVKYLLILDDVYERIDLAELGINAHHKLGKIVIGATGKGVLNLMKVDESILIKKLEYGAAKRFFKECLGLESTVDKSPVQTYIEKIIELVGGHVGALVGIANYMKGLGTNNTYSNAWEGIVNDLLLPNSPQKLELGALEKAYKLPYDVLKDKSLKKCLLYVALFPIGYHAHTSYLIECWKAEDFLQDYNTFKEARHKGYNICSKLTETHLVEWCGEEHLKMPLLFRKVALQIPYPDDEGDSKLLVRNISEINQPSKQEWIAKRISLMCGKLKLLPDRPRCNNTSTLLLQANLELTEIKNRFFVNMGNLKVLDLQRTGIHGLPESISKLEHLKCLYLNDCSRLKSLPTEMKKLKRLELLDIRRTLMRCLPCEIWCLKTLRCLRISVYSPEGDSSEIVMPSQQPCFSPKFLKLKFLEELTVHVDPQTQDKRLIVDQIKEVLKEAQHKHYLKVIWEPEESYLHNSNNVKANGSGLKGPTSLIGSHSNGQDITEHVNQLEITEASTSTTNSQHTESTKEWVQKRFKDK